MLSSAAILTTQDLRVRDLHCAHRRGGWSETEHSQRSAIVFPRRGSFRRRGAYGDEVIEPGIAYFQRAGEDEEFAHPHDGGDRCTSVGLSETLLAELLGGDPALPARLVPTAPRDELALRLMTGGVTERPEGPLRDPTRHEERVLTLVAHVLAGALPKRAAAGRPATAQARRTLTNDARESLAADPGLSLVQLARAIAVSPHHLSRVFTQELGVSITTYRRRLRLRAALENIEERGLARVAADAGFADHAHFTREVRALLGTTPSALQREIARPLDQPG
jgi:AraC-like DNA-binding protein